MAADADRMPPTKPSRNPATFFFRQLLGLWQRSGSRFDSRRLSLSSPKLVFRFCLFLRRHWSCFKSFTERKLFNLLASTEIGARQVSQGRLKQRWQKRDYVFFCDSVFVSNHHKWNLVELKRAQAWAHRSASWKFNHVLDQRTCLKLTEADTGKGTQNFLKGLLGLTDWVV